MNPAVVAIEKMLKFLDGCEDSVTVQDCLHGFQEGACGRQENEVFVNLASRSELAYLDP